MMTPEEVLELVRAGGLLPVGPDERPILAMLSGGRDSVCLLDLAVDICGAERVHALHVNYGLRPEAGEDERHCRELCERLGVALEVERAERPSGAGNLHAWARELRYGAADELARELDALIATGHTATDQVETILYRLAASPGRRALLGMSPRGMRLVRPLLGLTREQTAGYCCARSLSWREDSSNDDEQYARARVRNALLPALDAIHPAARENVLRTAQLLREEAVVLDALVDAELERDFDAQAGDAAAPGGGLLEGGGGPGVGFFDAAGDAPDIGLSEVVGDAPRTSFSDAAGDVPDIGLSEVAGDAPGMGWPDAFGAAPSVGIERLRDLPPVLARLIVVRLAEETAGAYVPQAGARLGEILALAERGGRAELHVGGLVGAVIEGGRLRMVRLPPRR